MTEPEEEWHELDQASVRKSLKDLIRWHMPGDYEDLRVALKQLREIVHEEMASAASSGVSWFIEHSIEKNTAAEARGIVSEVERDLAGMGLVLADPRSGAPARLTLASTPPAESHQSWLQLEPLDPANRTPPFRLAALTPLKLKLLPEPPRSATADRSRPR